MAAPVLAYNGYDCATGQPWEYQKIPVWGWIFLILDIVSILWCSWIISLIALFVTAVIIRSKLNIAVKIILSLLLVVATFVIGIAVAVALAPVLY